MARRHQLRPGEWESVATRLDEIISAQSGEDPFDEAFKLLLGRLEHEVDGGEPDAFLRGDDRPQGGDPARLLDQLLLSAARRWPGVVEGEPLQARLPAAALHRCAAVLASVRLLADDLVGLDALFEFVVGRAARGQKGQFFTPRHVIEEVVAMVAPRHGERIADPACGSGGFLRHALRRAKGAEVWGFDQDARAVRVARVMLAASGASATRVTRADSLERPLVEQRLRGELPEFRGFDAILTNPPFAGDVGEGYARGYELARGRRVERDVLFVERCVELLRPGGRLALVLPHATVGGEPWSYVRRWLLERVRVVAVLGLPRNTFLPHTGQKACVLLGLKRARPAPRLDDEEILFFVGERDGKDARGRLRVAAEGGGVDHDLGEATPRVRERFEALAAEGA